MTISTVSALCGDFIRLGDSRVKRIKEKGTYFYYLAKNEQTLDIDKFEEIQSDPTKKGTRAKYCIRQNTENWISKPLTSCANSTRNLRNLLSKQKS